MTSSIKHGMRAHQCCDEVVWQRDELERLKGDLFIERERMRKLRAAGVGLREALVMVPVSWGGRYEIEKWDAALRDEPEEPKS